MNLEGYEIEDDEKCDQSKWIALLDAKVTSQKVKINELVILLNKLSERIKVLEND